MLGFVGERFAYSFNRRYVIPCVWTKPNSFLATDGNTYSLWGWNCSSAKIHRFYGIWLSPKKDGHKSPEHYYKTCREAEAIAVSLGGN